MVKNGGTGTVILDGDGTETIDDETTQDIAEDENIQAYSDGTNWRIV